MLFGRGWLIFSVVCFLLYRARGRPEHRWAKHIAQSFHRWVWFLQLSSHWIFFRALSLRVKLCLRSRQGSFLVTQNSDDGVGTSTYGFWGLRRKWWMQQSVVTDRFVLSCRECHVFVSTRRTHAHRWWVTVHRCVCGHVARETTESSEF